MNKEIMNNNKSSRLKYAEEALLGSADRLDAAEQRINAMLDSSTPRIQHIADLAERETREPRDIRTQAGRILSPLMNRLKSNPKPFVWSSIRFLVGFGIVSFLLIRSQKTRADFH